jgi:hypothetical protein
MGRGGGGLKMWAKVSGFAPKCCWPRVGGLNRPPGRCTVFKINITSLRDHTSNSNKVSRQFVLHQRLRLVYSDLGTGYFEPTQWGRLVDLRLPARLKLAGWVTQVLHRHILNILPRKTGLPTPVSFSMVFEYPPRCPSLG